MIVKLKQKLISLMSLILAVLMALTTIPTDVAFATSGTGDTGGGLKDTSFFYDWYYGLQNLKLQE